MFYSPSFYSPAYTCTRWRRYYFARSESYPLNLRPKYRPRTSHLTTRCRLHHLLLLSSLVSVSTRKSYIETQTWTSSLAPWRRVPIRRTKQSPRTTTPPSVIPTLYFRRIFDTRLLFLTPRVLKKPPSPPCSLRSGSSPSEFVRLLCLLLWPNRWPLLLSRRRIVVSVYTLTTFSHDHQNHYQQQNW